MGYDKSEVAQSNADKNIDKNMDEAEADKWVRDKQLIKL